MRRRIMAAGFTLLEVILTFVLFAIVCAMAVSFFSSGITRTDIPMAQLQTDAQLQLVLENMISDQQTTYQTNLNGFNTNLGTIGALQYTYGSGSSYVVTQKNFVCPGDHNFIDSTTNQFLLVTIKPDANSGVSLTYLFNSTAGNCNTGGGS